MKNDRNKRSGKGYRAHTLTYIPDHVIMTFLRFVVEIYCITVSKSGIASVMKQEIDQSTGKT